MSEQKEDQKKTAARGMCGGGGGGEFFSENSVKEAHNVNVDYSIMKASKLGVSMRERAQICNRLI